MANPTPNPGEQDPSTQTGTRSHQNMGQPLQTPEQRLEEKRKNDAGANEKRMPQDRTDYKPPKEGEGQHKRSASERSQADDSAAKIEADEDVDNEKTQKANRTKASASKQHRKTAKPAKKVRKHK